MLRKKNKPSVAVQDTILSDRLSFLGVIVETCQHTGRHTVIAESGGQTYTVLIDRGGPFNVTGGGLTGSEALVKAAWLRQGMYTVIEGWPVDQPVYHLGLAAVLRGLILGTRTEAVQLPPARGVDAIRNAAWQTATTATPAGDGKEPEPTPAPAMYLAVAEAAKAPVEAIEAPIDAAETIEAPAVDIPEDTDTYLPEVARAAKVDPEDEAPAAPKHQGWIKRRVLQFLLWTVEVEDEPDHYTLGQVLILMGRSVGSAFAVIVSPITRPFINRWHQAREDWRRSGEVASRQEVRRTKPSATKPSKLRR